MNARLITAAAAGMALLVAGCGGHGTPTVASPTSSTTTLSPTTTTMPPLRVVVSTPPPPTVIRVSEVPGPGTYEASETTLAYRIVAPYSCNLDVGFSFGYQGISDHEAPFPVAHDTVYGPDEKPVAGMVDIRGTVYPLGDEGSYVPLGFYPQRGEVDLLTNDHVALDLLRCSNGPSVVLATVDASNPVLGIPDILVTPEIQP